MNADGEYGTSAVNAPEPPDLAEVARMLRALVAGAPAANAKERRLARRMEGAAVALESVPEPR